MYRLWEYCFCWHVRFCQRISFGWFLQEEQRIFNAARFVSMVQFSNLMTIASIIDKTKVSIIILMSFIAACITFFNLFYFTEKRYASITEKYKITKVKDILVIVYLLISFIAFTWAFFK